MTRVLLAAGFFPLLIAAWTSGAAWWNRSAPREAMTLTEREIWLDAGSDDDSVVTGTLTFHQPPRLLDREQLAELGFDVRVDPADRDASRYYARSLPRLLFVVLELDGPAWQALLADRRAQPAGERGPLAEPRRPDDADWMLEHGSRLVIVDVDRTASALEPRYPDASRYLITRAVVRALHHTGPDGRPYLTGSVVRIEPSRIYVPPGLAARLPRASGWRENGSRAAYRLRIRYGARWEPWIVGIE